MRSTLYFTSSKNSGAAPKDCNDASASKRVIRSCRSEGSPAVPRRPSTTPAKIRIAESSHAPSGAIQFAPVSLPSTLTRLFKRLCVSVKCSTGTTIIKSEKSQFCLMICTSPAKNSSPFIPAFSPMQTPNICRYKNCTNVKSQRPTVHTVKSRKFSPFNGVVRESASAMPPSPSAIHTFTGVMGICAKYAKINSLYKTDKNGSSDAKTETLFSRSAA